MGWYSNVPTRRLRYYVVYPERDADGVHYQSSYMSKHNATTYATIFKGEVKKVDMPLPAWVSFWGTIVTSALTFGWLLAKYLWG